MSLVLVCMLNLANLSCVWCIDISICRKSNNRIKSYEENELKATIEMQIQSINIRILHSLFFSVIFLHFFFSSPLIRFLFCCSMNSWWWWHRLLLLLLLAIVLNMGQHFVHLAQIHINRSYSKLHRLVTQLTITFYDKNEYIILYRMQVITMKIMWFHDVVVVSWCRRIYQLSSTCCN